MLCSQCFHIRYGLQRVRRVGKDRRGRRVGKDIRVRRVGKDIRVRRCMSQ
jgi:hypothetical protein